MSTEPLDFGVLLASAYSTFVDQMRRELAEAGHADLNRSFGYVARALDASPLTLRELARQLGMTSQGALKIVDDMEASGYLERVPDPSDGRAKRLRLTRRGRAVLAAARRFHGRFEEQLAARVGRKRAAVCRAVLETILDARAAPDGATALRPV